MFSALRQFNLTIWLIIFATFAGRFVQFMIWPFLAILLHTRFGLNELEVGLFLAVATMAGIGFGFYVGYLSDRLGRRKIILVGIVLSVAAMIMLGSANSLWMLFTGTLMQAVARPMVEDPGRALMTDMVEDRAIKDMALHMRYFALNVGAALGPILGAAAGLTGQQGTFFLLGAVHALYFLGAIVVFRIERPLQGSAMGAQFTFREVLGVLRRDKAFLLFVLASLICSIGYGQIESGLVQYLQQQSVPDLALLYAMLIGLNAATIVVLQFPLLKLMERIRPFHRSMYGVALFGLGFFGFGIAPIDPPYAFFFAMFLLSIGEAILFPTMSIIIDRIAPKDMKGSYFGAFSLAVIGFALAPLIGGYLLFSFGGFALWMVMTALAVSVAGLYLLADRQSGKLDE